MSRTKNTLLVILTFALLATVYSQEVSEDDLLNNEWHCIHDEIDKPVPVITQVEEEGFNDAQQGRRLTGTTSPQIRIYPYYGGLDNEVASYANYIKTEIVPPIVSYFEATLQVKYPVSGLLKVTSGEMCTTPTPSILRTGVSADFAYIVVAQRATGQSWVAGSAACSMAPGTKRPLVGQTTFNSALLKEPGTNMLLHEKNMICIMHEMTHTLGFSSQLFPYFIDANGKTLSGVVTDGTLDGAHNQIINVEPLVSMLRNYFGCPTLKGAYMENSGSDGTAGSHFERRQYAYEIMTSGLIYEMQYSQFSLGMLESSGWYNVDYSFADPFFFGQGAGCSFLTSTCVNGGASLGKDFCSSGTSCTIPGRGGGQCGADVRSDNCRFIQPIAGLDCEASSGSGALSSIQTFGRGKGSKCFEGTLGSSRAGGESTYCFTYTCSGSGSSTVLNVHVGGTTTACTTAGAKTVSGLAGALNCPDPVEFCSTVGQKVCPRNCMGRGTCVSGSCQCYSGFSGEDCALVASGTF